MKTWISIFATIGLLTCQAAAQTDEYEQAPIRYSESTPNNPASELEKRIQSGDHGLDMSSEKAFLTSVLKELKVPVESQMLVYSKTSLQNDLITPTKPRAIYFSDDCYVGWVQGGDIELIITDDNLGPVFYRFRVPHSFPAEFEIDDSPIIERSRGCLTCHGGTRTNNYPGMMVRSVRSDDIGSPIYSAGTHFTDHASPLSERWGGWFVTGKADGPRHMGNLIYSETEDGDAEIAKNFGQPLASLSDVINTDPYLVDKSDIIALMVLEHQVMAHNALTKAMFSTRTLLHRNRELAKLTGEDPEVLTESTQRVVNGLAEDILEVMLFRDEAPLTGWGAEGDPAFQEAFVATGPETADGGNLRDLHLLSRLFRTRLSYMIYSRSFDALPPTVKNVFYKQLWDALHDDEDPIKERERRRIVEILRETKSDLPPFWM